MECVKYVFSVWQSYSSIPSSSSAATELIPLNTRVHCNEWMKVCCSVVFEYSSDSMNMSKIVIITTTIHCHRQHAHKGWWWMCWAFCIQSEACRLECSTPSHVLIERKTCVKWKWMMINLPTIPHRSPIYKRIETIRVSNRLYFKEICWFS